MGWSWAGRAANAPALQAWSSRMARSPFNNTRQLPTAGGAGGTKFSGGIRGMNVRPERGVLGVERKTLTRAQWQGLGHDSNSAVEWV
jgi:hypothetical protein